MDLTEALRTRYFNTGTCSTGDGVDVWVGKGQNLCLLPGSWANDGVSACGEGELKREQIPDRGTRNVLGDRVDFGLDEEGPPGDEGKQGADVEGLRRRQETWVLKSKSKYGRRGHGSSDGGREYKTEPQGIPTFK